MKFGVITYRGVACFYEVTHTPILMGQGPSSPKILGPLTCLHTVWDMTTKFCLVIKLVYIVCHKCWHVTLISLW